MEIRKTVQTDIPVIMEIIGDAQEYLRSCGVEQWQDGYPTAAVIGDDIEKGISYVATENGEIIGTAAISFDGEPNYAEIRNGKWLNNKPYAIIHRIAVGNRYRNRGAAAGLMLFAEQLCEERGVGNIRIDTHADNKSMQRLLERFGYEYCGEITILSSGAPRNAYMKRVGCHAGQESITNP